MILSDFRINFNLKGSPILNQTKFIIISTQRSGTTYLSQLLNSHTNVHMGLELFKLGNNVDNVDNDNYRYHKDMTVSQFLDNYYNKYIKTYKAVGFTIMHNHLIENIEIVAYIKKNNIVCIHLERENHLKIAISRLKARQTGIYHTTKTISKEPFTIDIEYLMNELSIIDKTCIDLKNILNTFPTLTVKYEAILSKKTDELENIQKYLNLKINHTLTSSLKKTNPNDLHKSIKNYDEVSQKLKNTPYEKYLVMNQNEALTDHQGEAWSENTHRTLHPTNFNFGLANFIVNNLQPKDVLEIGSGLGYLARHIVDHSNVQKVYCIEPNDIKGVYRQNGFPKLFPINIFNDDHPAEIQHTFDIVISIEVAEHIDRSKHDRLFDFFVSHTNNWIIFSGARVGQGGHGHIAERPEEEWKDEFTKRGMIFQAKLTQQAREMCDKKNINHRKNLLIFKHPKKVSILKKIMTRIFS